MSKIKTCLDVIPLALFYILLVLIIIFGSLDEFVVSHLMLWLMFDLGFFLAWFIASEIVFEYLMSVKSPVKSDVINVNIGCPLALTNNHTPACFFANHSDRAELWNHNSCSLSLDKEHDNLKVKGE